MASLRRYAGKRLTQPSTSNAHDNPQSAPALLPPVSAPAAGTTTATRTLTTLHCHTPTRPPRAPAARHDARIRERQQRVQPAHLCQGAGRGRRLGRALRVEWEGGARRSEAWAAE